MNTFLMSALLLIVLSPGAAPVIASPTAAAPTPPAVAPRVAPELGISDHSILIGMSAAFTGGARASSMELYRGATALFSEVNAAGGVNGRTLALKAYDDGYQPDRAVRNTIQLLRTDEVFLLFSYFGTPTVEQVLPLLKKVAAENVYLMFPYTGGDAVRSPLYASTSFTLKASYAQEVEGLVNALSQVNHKRIAVFYQADAYGRNG